MPFKKQCVYCLLLFYYKAILFLNQWILLFQSTNVYYLIVLIGRSSHQCRDLLDEARNYHLMPERRSQLTSFVTRARCCKDLVGVIYAVGGQTKSGNSLSTVEVSYISSGDEKQGNVNVFLDFYFHLHLFLWPKNVDNYIFQHLSTNNKWI